MFNLSSFRLLLAFVFLSVGMAKTCNELFTEAVSAQADHDRSLREAVKAGKALSTVPAMDWSKFEAADKKCAEEKREFNLKIAEASQKVAVHIKRACELRMTTNENTSLCAGIPPKREVLEQAHKMCNEWPTTDAGPKPSMCSRLIPLTPATPPK